MTMQPAVLQVVILKDGLLVGTEVFPPGQYSIGSGETSDLRLEDAQVASAHAALYFQNGRTVIAELGEDPIYVNGHHVKTCELRPVDEVVCGPFSLKVRVMTQKPQPNAAAASQAAALLSVPPRETDRLRPQNALPPTVKRPVAEPPVALRPTLVPGGQGPAGGPTKSAPATMVSSRRQNAAPQAAMPIEMRPSHLRPVADVPFENFDEKTESKSIAIDVSEISALTPPRAYPNAAKTVIPTGNAKAAAKQRAQWKSPAPIPSADGTKGKPRLFVESYWADVRRAAASFGHIDPKKKLVASEDDNSTIPLWGMGLEGKDFVFAEQRSGLFRVYVPPRCQVDRLAHDGKYYRIDLQTLEGGEQGRYITLGNLHAVRFIGDSGLSVVAYVQPAVPKPFLNPLLRLPWLMLASLTVSFSAFVAFILSFDELPENSDFDSRRVNPVAVKLIAPPKAEVKKKLAEKVEKLIKPEKKKEAPKPREAPKEVVRANTEAKKAIKSIEKLTASGPAIKDLLAAVDKLGSGPGSKSKNDFKLSGLLGKQAIANAGQGTFGLGGGGAGGIGIKGAELLRGKGGAGIGALGAGAIGKGNVAGTVTHAVSRNVGAQGSIDKEAVAKVINAHLHEVSSCYERALLKTPGLSGKIVLEWQISTSGTVGAAKTKTSTMQSAAVEACILAAIKDWRFPAAKGAGVLITYPFMFNSVGY